MFGGSSLGNLGRDGFEDRSTTAAFFPEFLLLQRMQLTFIAESFGNVLRRA